MNLRASKFNPVSGQLEIMKIGFLGMSHLGQTLMAATKAKGFEVTDQVNDYNVLHSFDILFVTQDVRHHEHLREVDDFTGRALSCRREGSPVVIVSQVPPGFTRRWANSYDHLYYQVDTIVMKNALERAMSPEQFVVGCKNSKELFHPAYEKYLYSFGCPIRSMSYESAELAKLAINYFLAKEIEASTTLSAVAQKVGADWKDVASALRGDARIGQHAYLEPGHPGGHLPRDLHTIAKLACQNSTH